MRSVLVLADGLKDEEYSFLLNSQPRIMQF